MPYIHITQANVVSWIDRAYEWRQAAADFKATARKRGQDETTNPDYLQCLRMAEDIERAVKEWANALNK